MGNERNRGAGFVQAGNKSRSKTAARVRGARRIKKRRSGNDHQLALDFNRGVGKQAESPQKGRCRQSRSSGGRTPAPGFYLRSHWQAMSGMVRKMSGMYTTTLATLLVMGIVISLPSSLYVFLKNAKVATEGWTDYAQITLYLEHGMPSGQAEKWLTELRARDEFLNVEFVSAAQGLEDFQKQSDIARVLQHLDNNPLPAAIVLTPRKEYASASRLQAITQKFKARTGILDARLDFQWVRRLWAMIHVAETSIGILAVLFACTVLFVMGSSIGLLIEEQRREIELLKLIGGTQGYIRRPFLYMGMILGSGAGVLAVGIVAVILSLMQGPMNDLFAQFQARFLLNGLSVRENASVILMSTFLGWSGAWSVTTWHLRQIQPE